MRKKVVLTGIKPTGTPHLGNYVGAVKPGIELSRDEAYQCYYFIADYHALTTIRNRKDLQHMVYEVAATWLACGLDPERALFYKQSDIPEIFELSWILACVTPKGLMNRAHAYKAAVQKNEESQDTDRDAGVNMGLYNYPVLMSADILMFNADYVPVGSDQVQHVEIARDLAENFNNAFGKTIKLPEYMIPKVVQMLPGTDGRKMSKSYNNTIPLFAPREQLKKMIARVKTDSTLPTEPKSTEDSLLFMMYHELAAPSEVEELRRRYREGISWADVKQLVFEAMDAKFAEPREKFNALMADTATLDRILAEGKDKARAISTRIIADVRKATGIN